MIGRLISGRYRLIAPLGDGGMATIWRAVDEQLDREVAVKLLRPQFSSDPGFAARFKLEARSAGGLSHPNIVSVYDYGTDGDDGDQFIVMELVEGRDLSGVLLDIGLPDISGWEVLEALKAAPYTADVPVHIVSGGDEDARGRELGAVGFLRKPVERVEAHEQGLGASHRKPCNRAHGAQQRVLVVARPSRHEDRQFSPRAHCKEKQ